MSTPANTWSGGRQPGLYIDTSIIQTPNASGETPLSSNTQLPNDNIPSFLVSGSPSASEKRPVSPITKSFRGPLTGSHKEGHSRRTEVRKLLGHVLNQLSHRTMPPTVYDTFDVFGDEKGSGVGDFVKSTIKGGRNYRSTEHVLEAEDGTDMFSTDETFELMVQLRDVLTMARAQGWKMFDDGVLEERERYRESGGRSPSPFRRSLNSLQPVGRRSRSPSPASGKQDRDPGLLAKCISILSSVVLEDCRFKVASPRPTRPPNALQAMTLEVAQFLLFTHRHNPSTLSDLAFALIPAFATFPYEVCGRLLAFFEECVVRNALAELRLFQGLDSNPLVKEMTEKMDRMGPGAISIQVDEAPDEGSFGTNSSWAQWSTVSSMTLALRSSNAPMQQSISYHLSSLVKPLLAAALERFEMTTEPHSRGDVIYHLHRLVTVIVDLKFDAYLDILEVLAYHTSKAKRLAAHLLATFWPKAIGHVAISRPPVVPTAGITNGQLFQPSSQSHQFVPWRFGCNRSSTSTSAQKQECDICARNIEGFGLFCSLCVCSVHLGCYSFPEGNLFLNHSSKSSQKTRRAALYRFSTIPCRKSRERRKNRHRLKAVNLFTLTICSVCREPLWGCCAQGLHCSNCLQFVHISCTTSSSFTMCEVPPGSDSSNSVDISWSSLRQTCMKFYADVLSLNQGSLRLKSFEDISTISGALWTQVQLLENGVTHGTLVIDGAALRSNDYTPQEFELHHVLFWCTELISSGIRTPSPGTMDYVQHNSIQCQDDSLFFDWSYLIFISAAIKMPLEPTSNTTGGLLPISSPVDSGSVEPRGEDATHPFEVAPLSHLRDTLGREFHFHCDIAAIFMISHLHHMGFVERLDSEPLLFDGNKHTLCTFPLPLGLDVSSDVETLFAAVEASLSDLDLFVNEFGWLLLNRRLWPSGSASEYALGRLTRSIVLWILAEDEDLATILRDYLANQLPLPGVRSINDPAPWPPVHGTRHTPSASVNNGGDYVASRRALVNRYALPWLAALHNQNSDKYAAILYDICNEVVDNTYQFTWETLQHPEEDPDKYEKLLRLMLRVSHSSIMFSASEALFVRWLRDMSSKRDPLPSLPSLTRIFQREPDSSQRYSNLDGGIILSDALRFEPWSLVADTASESGGGLQISLQWLRIFAFSGVNIPYITLEQMMNLVGQSEDAALDFTHVLLLNAWQRSPDPERVQKLVATLHSRMHVSFIKSLQKRSEPTQSITILKRSLAVCLLLYGCDRERIVASNLISEGEIKDLPSRRKSSHQVPTMVDPIVIDPSLMMILEAYLSANNDTISCIIAGFLNCFLMDSPYLEAHEVDNFILRNGHMLCNSAFQFYGIQRQELFALRFGFLLRVVVVETQPFRELLENLFRSGDWEIRLAAVRKLFRLILDIKVPAQTVDGRQWRSSITDAFYFFFGSLWRDKKQEIRVAVETLCSTLLPSHFEEISLCWTELFATSPVEERLKLAAFLVQLRSRFPSWQVLSWNVILEILAEDHFDQEASNKRDGALSSHLSMYGLTTTEENGDKESPQGPNNEMTSLRVSVLLLSLDMVANGILVDHNDLLRIKLHMARVFGFDDVHAVPAPDGLTFLVKFGKLISVPQYAIPCISQLLPLLDSPHPASLISMEPPRGNNNTTPLLVGAVFIDVLLGLFSSAKEITSLPILSVKSLLESLSVVIYKHNFENIYIRHLQPSLKQAVTLTLELMLEDINYECRQLALYVTQAYIRKFHGTMRSLIHYALEQVAKLVISQSHTIQDPFLDQARSFLENTLQTYSSNGIFVGLIRRKLDRGIFLVLKQVLDANAKERRGGESLREYLLRDTLPRAVESDRHVFQDVLNNLQIYVEDVHHHNYSKEFMIFVGQHLTLLARRISEWTPDIVNPSPLLNIAAVLMQHNKAQSREMLSYTETVLRVALTRLTVDTSTLSRLVHVTSALYKRSDQQGTNIIITVLFEILSDGLRMKSRVLSETIGALAQTIMTTHAVGVPLTRCYNHLFVGLAGPGLHFLFNHPWGDTRSEKDLTVSLVVAKMVFATVSESDMIVTMAEQGTEKLGRQSMSMRGWNVLVLAILMEGSESWWDRMFSQLGALSIAHHAALKSYTHPNGTITESAIPDINHAYITIKLWLMLAQKKSTRIGAGNDFALKVWEHLWPPFEALSSVSAAEVQAGLPMTLPLLVWSTVADLFVFLRNLRSPVTLHTSSQILILERLKSLGAGSGAQVGKLSRAIRSLNEPPSYLSNEVMIDQAAKDIIATEKLRELDILSREAAKMAPERRGIRQEFSH